MIIRRREVGQGIHPERGYLFKLSKSHKIDFTSPKPLSIWGSSLNIALSQNVGRKLEHWGQIWEIRFGAPGQPKKNRGGQLAAPDWVTND